MHLLLVLGALCIASCSPTDTSSKRDRTSPTSSSPRSTPSDSTSVADGPEVHAVVDASVVAPTLVALDTVSPAKPGAGRLAVDPAGRVRLDSSFDVRPAFDSKGCREDGYGADISMVTVHDTAGLETRYFLDPPRLWKYKNCRERPVKSSAKLLRKIDPRLVSVRSVNQLDASAFSESPCRNTRVSLELSSEIQQSRGLRSGLRFTAGSPGIDPLAPVTQGRITAKVMGETVATWAIGREIIRHGCIDGKRVSVSVVLALEAACAGDKLAFAANWIEAGTCWDCHQRCTLQDDTILREQVVVVDLGNASARTVVDR